MNDDELYDDELYEYDTIDYNFFLKRGKKTYITSNLLHNPGITKFKKVFKRHTNFFEKSNKYPIEQIHLMKPKI